MALSRDEREQFLAEPHIGVLAVTAEPGRGPLQVPVWYGYEPGGTLWILTGATSRKAGLIERAGRFSLLVERVSPTVRYVSVEGPVAGTEPGTPAHHREMAGRYLTGEALERYLAWAIENLKGHAVIRMRPERWLSSDLGAL